MYDVEADFKAAESSRRRHSRDTDSHYAACYIGDNVVSKLAGAFRKTMADPVARREWCEEIRQRMIERGCKNVKTVEEIEKGWADYFDKEEKAT